ncbi:MAG: fimbria/pilus periplasmic chaperone [Pontixanthobacter sp.]
MTNGAMKLSAKLVLPLAVLLSSGVSLAQDSASPAPSKVDGAAMVSLAPLRIEMDGPDRAATLRVFNPSGRAIGVQVRAFGWKQESGQDVFSAANDVMVSPSIITIDPGETQIFRVVRKDQPAEGERRYRVAVDQLPDPELTRAGEATARIRFTIPMFVDRAAAAPAQLAWTLGEDGLTVTNSGGQTVRMVNLDLTGPQAGKIPVTLNGLYYVQGGSVLNWPLEGACPSGPINITASIDGEDINAQVANTCG